MGKSETATYKFTVKEGEASASGKDDAPVWLMAEPMVSTLSILEHGSLTLRLKDGANISHAQEVARYLNENIKAISHTKY